MYHLYEGYLCFLVFFPNTLVQLHLWQSCNLAPWFNLIGYDITAVTSPNYCLNLQTKVVKYYDFLAALKLKVWLHQIYNVATEIFCTNM